MEKTLYEGICVGGPMDGVEGQSRFPNGFLLADKPTNRAWVYDWQPNNIQEGDTTGRFVARDEDVLDLNRALIAAEGSMYDVRALDVGNEL